MHNFLVAIASILLLSSSAHAKEPDFDIPPGTCLSSKAIIVQDIAREYGATLQWSGKERADVSIELYSSKIGWALLRINEKAVTDTACLVDAGKFGTGNKTRFPCDHDSSINRLAELGSKLQGMFWARSAFAPRSYILYVAPSGQWAIRGSNPEITGLPTALTSEQCATIDGPRSQTVRPFE